MQRKISHAVLASVIAAMLLSLAGVAAAYDDATALTGTVVNVNRDLNYVTVRDDVTGKSFKIDTRSMNTRGSIDVWSLRAGDRVSATGGWSNSETFRADRVMPPTPRALNRIANGITGTVESVNRDLNYITVRDDATGQSVKVDVRKMDARRSVNVWQLRNGDVVTVNGKWANKRGSFRADFVNFGNQSPMTSGYSSPNVITGTVETVNRDLNYVMVRDDATRQPVKIDVRDMDTRRSVNVWKLRTGDRITINGSWSADRDRFKAEMVGF
jgi:NMD protein affecting ribosome stability and mRNA decay